MQVVTESEAKKVWRQWQPFVVAIGLTFLVGALSTLASGNGQRALYQSLTLPSGAVPGEVFGLVWPVWYLLLGVSAALVFRGPASMAKSEGLRFYELHLLILFVWPILFFRMEAYWASFTLLLLLVFVLYMMMARYYTVSKPAFWILIPYCLWILYALWLNLRVAMLN